MTLHVSVQTVSRVSHTRTILNASTQQRKTVTVANMIVWSYWQPTSRRSTDGYFFALCPSYHRFMSHSTSIVVNIDSTAVQVHNTVCTLLTAIRARIYRPKRKRIASRCTPRLERGRAGHFLSIFSVNVASNLKKQHVLETFSRTLYKPPSARVVRSLAQF